MTIFLNVLFLILGLIMLVGGANYFVNGASAVAKKFKIPSMFIGLTIIAIGTSLPELSVSLASAIKNSTDLSLGNIVGSNMMNMFLIFGIVVLIKSVGVTKTSKKIDFTFLIGITLLLLLFSLDTFFNETNSNIISRTEGLILIIIFIIYLIILIFNAKNRHKQMLGMESSKLENSITFTNYNNTKQNKVLKTWQIIIFIILGLGAVVFGAECVSATAQFLALKMGMSESLVGLTIVAIGTSLPELATSIVAATKGENAMALGNIIGSNIINIALVLGAVSLINQVYISFNILIDLIILCITTIFFTIMCITRKNLIPRYYGIIFVLIYIAYMAFSIVRNYCFNF